MHKIAAAALTCLTLVAGAAPAGAAPVTGPDPAAATRLRLAWAVGPAAAGIITAPTYLAGSTYHMEGVADPTKTRSLVRVIRRDAGTGRRLPFAAGAVDSITGYRPVASGSTLFVVTFREGTRISAYRPDGSELWHRDQPGEEFPNEPKLAGRYLTTVSKSGCSAGFCTRTTVFGWHVADGSPAWSYQLADGYSKLATTPGYVVVKVDSTVTVLSAVSGGLLWSRPVPGGAGIAVDDAQVYVASGSLQAFDVRNGTPAWTGADGGYGAVYPSDYGIFVTGRGRYAAYDQTGRRRWWSGIHPRSTLTVDSGVVYFQQSPTQQGAGPAHLVAMRASNGAVLSRVRIWSRTSIGDVTVGGGRVFTKALNERIVGFAPSVKAPAARDR